MFSSQEIVSHSSRFLSLRTRWLAVQAQVGGVGFLADSMVWRQGAIQGLSGGEVHTGGLKHC